MGYPWHCKLCRTSYNVAVVMVGLYLAEHTIMIIKSKSALHSHTFDNKTTGTMYLLAMHLGSTKHYFGKFSKRSSEVVTHATLNVIIVKSCMICISLM